MFQNSEFNMGILVINCSNESLWMATSFIKAKFYSALLCTFCIVVMMQIGHKNQIRALNLLWKPRELQQDGKQGTFINITATPHEPQGVSNHRPLDCLFNNLSRLPTKKLWKLRITGRLWREFSLVDSPLERPVRWKACPYHNVISNNVILSGTHICKVQRTNKDYNRHFRLQRR